MSTHCDDILVSLSPGFRAVVIGASGGIGAAICDLLTLQQTIGELVPLSRSRGDIDLTD